MRCRTSTGRYPVALLPSHRSYIDPVVLASVLQRADLPPTYKLGGINVAFWPMGPMGRRAGLIFIRRSFRDDPVYKLALREYVGWLAEHRQNLEWYIEGGRTPHRQAARPAARACSPTSSTRCTTTAATTSCSNRCRSSTTSCSTSRSTRARRRARPRHPSRSPGSVSYARAQRTRYSRGDIHVAFGEPISVRDHLTRELTEAAEPRTWSAPRCAPAAEARVRGGGPHQHGHADHAAGADHDGAALGRPRAHRRPTARAARALRRRTSTSGRSRSRAVRSRPATPCSPGSRRCSATASSPATTTGSEVVYLIQPEQRIAAAYHRNGILHFFVLPAIVDLATADGRRSTCTTRRSRCATCSSSSSSSRRRASSSPRSTPRRRRRTVRSPRRSSARSSRRTGRPPRRSPRTATSPSTPRRSRRGVRPGRAVPAAGPHLLRRRGVELLRRRRGAPGRPPGPARRRSLETGPDLAARRAEFAEELHALVRRVRAAQARAAARFLELMRA